MDRPLIDQAVDRFLAWKLPSDFSPDCGISFNRTYLNHLQQLTEYAPIGTNLLNAIQAKAMLEHVAAPLLALASTRYAWLIENGKQGDELRYRSMDQGQPTWTTSPHEALNFSRRKDAECFAAEDEDAWRIVEHGFES